MWRTPRATGYSKFFCCLLVVASPCCRDSSRQENGGATTEQESHKVTQRETATPEHSARLAPRAPAPSQPEVTLSGSVEVENVCEADYGHRDFKALVLAFNGLPADQRLPKGTVLKTPPVTEMFDRAGINARYRPVVAEIARISDQFHALLPDYREQRSSQQLRPEAMNISLRPDTVASLEALATALDTALAALSHTATADQPPEKAIAQLRQSSEGLRTLASGAVDSEGYDFDLVGKRFALGLSNLWWWTKEGHQ